MRTLPLSKDKPGKIAVIGHMARQPIIGGGGSGQVFPKETINPYSGIAAALGVPADTMTINCTQTNKDFGYEQPSCLAGMIVADPEMLRAYALRATTVTIGAMWPIDVHLRQQKKESSRFLEA